jgi:hypothetical protein
MATDLIYVETIGATPSGDRVTFLVSGRFADGRLGMLQVETVDQWRAALCQRGKDLNLPVRVAWREGRARGFKDLIAVELLEAGPQPISVRARVLPMPYDSYVVVADAGALERSCVEEGWIWTWAASSRYATPLTKADAERLCARVQEADLDRAWHQPRARVVSDYDRRKPVDIWCAETVRS